MIITIRPVQTRATCNGSSSPCETYKGHPDWPNLKRMDRHIPAGEIVLRFDAEYRGRSYCLCHKHGMEFLNSMANLHKQALALDWDK